MDGDDLEIEELSKSEVDTKVKDKIFYFEINIDKAAIKLDKSIKSADRLKESMFKKYETISEFPSSVRDFSFSISDISKYDKVISLINKLDDKNLKDSFIFDFYKNKKINEIKLGVRMIFQSKESTLSEKEIQKSSKILIKPILEISGVSIPGMQ